MARKKSDGRADGGLGRVLVVEDDAILALATEDALREAGAVDVTICSTTAEALAALREHKPDAMVLDVHLADRDDGWAIAELVSEVGPHPPRIVFSTGAPDDIPDEIAELGPVLEKPYDSAQLIALLRKPPRESLLARLREALNP
jgi:CheY-like chemotaxis protein